MKRHLGIIVIAAAAVGLSASIAGATITVTNAHVENDYTYDFPGRTDLSLPAPGTTVVLDSSSPGNTFNGTDVNGVGFVSSIDPATGGLLRVRTNGTTYISGAGIQNSYRAATSGSISFVADAPFSMSAGTPADLAQMIFSSGSLKLTNVTSGQFVMVTPPDNGIPTLTGDLSTTAAPAGNYQVDFTVTDERETGVTRPGALELNLVTTPEPATLAALVVPSLPLQRRRR